MIQFTNTVGRDIEALINKVSADFAQGDKEDKKVTKAQISSNTEKIRDKREERIENLKEQIKGVSGGGGCFKFLKAVFKIIDFLAKPLSLLTFNQLKTNLSKTLDMLQDSKNQKKLMGLKINGQDILKVLQSLKTTLSDDMETLKQQDQLSAKESQRILQIINDIEKSFGAANQV